MEKVDIAIAAVGAVAVLATVLGVVFYEDLAGEVDVEFIPATEPLASISATTVPASGFSSTWQLPDNSTAANLDVTIAFTGTHRGGSAATGQITVTLSGPNGTMATETGTITIPAGTATGAPGGAATPVVVPIAVNWSMLPPPTTTTDLGSFNQNVTIMEPLTISIEISTSGQGDGPGGPIPGAPGQTSTYSYTAAVTGNAHTYLHRAAVTDAEPTN